MIHRTRLLAAGLLSIAAPAWAQFAPIGVAAGQGFRLENVGAVQASAAAEEESPAESPERDVHQVGGPQFQAGDPDAGDEPVQKLPQTKDVFRSQYSITKPKAEEKSPIVEKARAFMAAPPLNPNNGTHDWTGWCLGFVNATQRAVRGQSDAQMRQPAAKNAYYAMAAAGRISKDFSDVPAGAALLWAGCSQWGHAAIATGEMSADGTPIMITTSHKGIREMSTKQFGCGLPSGWGKI